MSKRSYSVCIQDPIRFYRDLGRGLAPERVTGSPEVVAAIMEPWRPSWGHGGHLGRHFVTSLTLKGPLHYSYTYLDYLIT